MERIKQRFLVQSLHYFLSPISFFIVLTGLLLVVLYSFQLFDFWEHSAQQTEIINYLLQHQSSGLLNVDALNINEKRHLLDVQQLYSSIEQLFKYSLLAYLAILITFKKHIVFRKLLSHVVYLGGSSLIVFIVLNMSQGFMLIFDYSHRAFFIKGTWLFPSDSYLIQLFPLDYFYHFSLVYVSFLSLFLSSSALFIYYKK